MKTNRFFILMIIIFLMTLIFTPVSAEKNSADGTDIEAQDQQLDEELVVEQSDTELLADIPEDEVKVEPEAPMAEPEEVLLVESEETAVADPEETPEAPLVEPEETPEAPPAEPEATPPVESEEVLETPLVEPDQAPQTESEQVLETPIEEQSLLLQEQAVSIMSIVDVQNYFVATGTSTNDHYSVVGVYIDLNGDVHLIIDNDKNTANQTRFHSPMLNGLEALGYELGFNDYEQYWNEVGTSLTLSFPNGDTTLIEGVRLFDFNFGPLIDFLQEENTLQILNQADGFSIEGLTFTLNLGHAITKEANQSLVTIGDEVIYTIVVTNTGDFRLTGINVYDDVPAGLTIVGVSEDNVSWNNPTFTLEGDVIIDEGLILDVAQSKTYYLKAEINTNAYDGQIITNTAFTGGNVPTQEDTAYVEVYVLINAITISKQITGNFGDLSRAFAFTVIANRGTAAEQTYNFDLSHNETYVIEDLPANTVLVLTEQSGDYEVTVQVGGMTVSPNEAGEYVIALANDDATIAVTNNKDVIIDTGITFDSLPFVLILAFVILGLGMVFIRNRNHTYEDE